MDESERIAKIGPVEARGVRRTEAYAPELAAAVADLRAAIRETPLAKALYRFMLWLNGKLARR